MFVEERVCALAGGVESRDRQRRGAQTGVFRPHRHRRLSPGMGESEAEEAPPLKDLSDLGEKGSLCISVLNTGGSILQDLGGEAVRGWEAGSAMGLQLLHSQALGQRMIPENTRGSQGSPGGLCLHCLVLQARTKRH